MQCIKNLLKIQFCRYYSSKSTHVLEQLKSRHLVRVSGDDAATLLQGLITNDIQHLSKGAGNIYALILNTKGRVLYDTIIYRPTLENTYYLEVDSQASELVKRHLLLYRLRKRVDITIDPFYRIWVYFNSVISENTTPSQTESNEDPIIEGKIVPCTVLGETSPDNYVTSKKIGDQEMHTFRDPRLAALGTRILAPTDYDNNIKKYFPSGKGPTYKWFRYRLGIGEGIEELPPGNCFPLEANGDYLHGVSFHKGCYIGQELTARTHHTGVIRKRLMPLMLEKSFILQKPTKDEPVKAGDLNVGKLRGYEDDSGLALLRIQQALDAPHLTVNNTSAKTLRPTWWPVELPKEKISVETTQ